MFCITYSFLPKKRSSKNDLGKCTMFILLLLCTHTLPCSEDQATTRGQQDFGFAYAFWPAVFAMV